ncbi:MAG TPA: AAA family ATPase, partial [Fimbriimonas sp.]
MKAGKLLETLGVYGFGPVENVILSALVAEDPLLLVGSSGTGKTYLLNSIAEAMGLEHRHYNASLVSFD